MINRACKTFIVTAGILALFSGLAWAGAHDLNGTWTLLAPRSTLNGEPEMTAGTVVINVFEDKISLAENFTYANPFSRQPRLSRSRDDMARRSGKEIWRRGPNGTTERSRWM
jgi:hypothetical protein